MFTDGSARLLSFTNYWDGVAVLCIYTLGNGDLGIIKLGVKYEVDRAISGFSILYLLTCVAIFRVWTVIRFEWSWSKSSTVIGWEVPKQPRLSSKWKNVPVGRWRNRGCWNFLYLWCCCRECEISATPIYLFQRADRLVWKYFVVRWPFRRAIGECGSWEPLGSIDVFPFWSNFLTWREFCRRSLTAELLERTKALLLRKRWATQDETLWQTMVYHSLQMPEIRERAICSWSRSYGAWLFSLDVMAKHDDQNGYFNYRLRFMAQVCTSLRLCPRNVWP